MKMTRHFFLFLRAPLPGVFMEPQIFRVSPTNWLRFWLISAPAASTNHDNVVRRK